MTQLWSILAKLQVKMKQRQRFYRKQVFEIFSSFEVMGLFRSKIWKNLKIRYQKLGLLKNSETFKFRTWKFRKIQISNRHLLYTPDICNELRRLHTYLPCLETYILIILQLPIPVKYMIICFIFIIIIVQRYVSS